MNMSQRYVLTGTLRRTDTSSNGVASHMAISDPMKTQRVASATLAYFTWLSWLRLVTFKKCESSLSKITS